MATKIPAIIRVRRGTADQWNSSNPVLQEGEIGYITSGDNEGQLKVGDGVNTWNNIPFTLGLIHWGKILGVLGNQTDLQNEFDKTNDLIIDLENTVNSWIGRGGYLTPFDFGTDTPTQQQLTDQAMLEITGITDQTEIFNGTKIKNLFDNHLWVLTNTQDTDPVVFEWTDQGLETSIPQFSEGIGGYIIGASESDGIGYIRATPEGKGQVTGLVEMNGLLTMGPPDEKQAVVKVQANGAGSTTWVSDARGYALCYGRCGGNGDFNVTKNGVQVYHIYIGDQSDMNSPLIQVDIGDVIVVTSHTTVTNSIGRRITFIPPVINPPTYLETMPLLDYSTVEQDTGKKWIDSRPIYQRTNGTAPDTDNTIQTVIHPIGGTTYWYVK